MGNGFALVVCLSLMVLLALLAVGLLSLSTIGLRSSAASDAQAEARSNARLALLFALGDLQKHAGPDTRITATSGTLEEKSPRPALTGVWNSRRLDPESPADDGDQGAGAKAGDFRKWLVSHGQASATAMQDFGTSPPASDAVALVSRSVVDDPAKEVLADRVMVASESREGAAGAFAYAVLDDGVKARVNLPDGEEPAGELAARAMALGSGQAPGLNRIDGLDVADEDEIDARSMGKMVSIGQSEFAHGARRGSFGRYFHDLTAHSAGLMTRVTTGGLKEDLNLLAENTTLPPDYAGRKLYQSTWGLNVPSDPLWQPILAGASVFRGKNFQNRDLLFTSGGRPTLRATAPTNWSAGTTVPNGATIPTRNVPTGPVLIPSIAKVQMVFSMLARDIYNYPKGSYPTPSSAEIHGPWGNNFRNSSYDYLLHMIYTPVITLHNPYNVAIEFTNLKIDFVNLPFAIQIFRNGEPQSTSLVPIGRMYGPTESGGQTKRFGITLTNRSANGAPIATPVRMLPGEVKVFSPYIPPNLTWAGEVGTQAYFFDWRNENETDGRGGGHVDTSKIQATPGWRGDGIGYDLDWFAPTGYRVSDHEREGGREFHRGGCIGLRRNDRIHVEFAPLPDPSVPEKRFAVEMTLVNANRNINARTSVIEFNYETNDGLQKTLLGENGRLRYPEDGELTTLQMLDHSSTALRDYVNTKPFALFSAYAKTTHGGFDPSSDDGSHPAKPWTFHNHTGVVSTQRIVSEHPSHHAHEINLIRLPGHTDEVIDIQPDTDRGNFVTGHTVFNGRRFGTLFEVPLGPIQSPVSLNFTNPAASYYLPRFTAPIGNSFAHPLMSTSSILETGNGGTYADHSYLLNSIFFDGYYCSGIQTRGGPFGDGISASALAESFLKSGGRLADSRFLPHLADGVTPDQALDMLTGAEAHRHAAAYQMLAGAFNVNSTSVDAWKAVLSSMRGTGGAVIEVPGTGSGGAADAVTDLDPPKDKKGALFSRFRLPNSQADDGNPDAFWHGPRALSERQLDTLAVEIVKQVRERGPFLSMGEFVNRRLGPPGRDTLAGALQVAIDEAGLNGDADLAGYRIDGGRVASLKLRTPEALLGLSAQGAPGYLTQADILAMLGNSATVRSDTFTIRAYGESRGADGTVQARAWCEAVVQRMPEFVDATDGAATRPEDLESETNKSFGRRFAVQSFRWLGSGEI